MASFLGFRSVYLEGLLKGLGAAAFVQVSGSHMKDLAFGGSTLGTAPAHYGDFF